MLLNISNLLQLQTRSSIIFYDPDTGLFYRKIYGRVKRVNELNGSPTISVDGKQYIASRLAWFMFYGKWPKNVIDHIDRDPTNNKIKNLRDVTQKINCTNIKEYDINDDKLFSRMYGPSPE